MRLDFLKIDGFKNLRGFEVDFDQDSQTTVLVGRNGSGKSNLLEALTIIFRDLDLGEKTSFKYRLQYFCRGHKVFVDSDPNREKPVYVNIDGKEVTFTHFRSSPNREFLPNFVFGYYSGPSERMARHFTKHQKKFYDDLLRGVDTPLRPLFYALPEHSKFALLAFFNEEDEEILEFLNKNLWIEGLDSVLFVMREPPWKSKEGDHRFWKARGTVNSLLDKLYGLAIAPIRINQTVSLDFRRSTKLEYLYLYLQDATSLKQLSRLYKNQQEFFKALESTNKSNLLHDVRIKIKVRKANGSLTFQDLSEGEQQLIMVLGLLRFTKEDESLFLLDEPDTHLNPAWSLQYIDFLQTVVGDQETSHIIMTTHDPLTIAGLKREQVQIIQRDERNGSILAIHPEEDPRGMGVAALLTSDIYGLRSSLDQATMKDLDVKRLLENKVKKGETLSEEEHRELERINRELLDLDFTKTARDPLYEPFVRAMSEVMQEEKMNVPELTPAQQERQKEAALEIVKRLKAKKDAQE